MTTRQATPSPPPPPQQKNPTQTNSLDHLLIFQLRLLLLDCKHILILLRNQTTSVHYHLISYGGSFGLDNLNMTILSMFITEGRHICVV